MKPETQPPHPVGSSALLGRKVDAYYPVSKHFCWSGTVTAVEGRRVRVKCDDFENLEDWFGIENVREAKRPNIVAQRQSHE